jgi:hypothetical protein
MLLAAILTFVQMQTATSNANVFPFMLFALRVSRIRLDPAPTITLSAIALEVRELVPIFGSVFTVMQRVCIQSEIPTTVTMANVATLSHALLSRHAENVCGLLFGIVQKSVGMIVFKIGIHYHSPYAIASASADSSA